MHLKRVSANVGASIAASLVFFSVTAAPALADANPNNEGHHYGQLKHPKHSPAPVPSPNPVPTPASTPLPKSHPGKIGASPGTASPPITSSDPPLISFVPVTQHPVAQTRTAISTPVPGDPWWWLLLVILPALAAAWVIAFRRVMLGTARRLRPASQLATAAARA